MEIFKDQFDETNRVNQTSRSRYNQPPPDQRFNQPNWRAIPKDGVPEPVAEDSDPQPAKVEDHIANPLSSPNVGFDEDDLAIMSAKIWDLAFAEGALNERAQAQDQSIRLISQIEQSIAQFSQSLRLPLPAIKAQLTDLLQALAEQISLPDDKEKHAEAMSRAIDRFLHEIDRPEPLTLHLNPGDAALVEDLLTKLADSRNESELRVVIEPERNTGDVGVGWAGGGMERLVSGRRAAIQAMLAELSGEEDTPVAAAHAAGDVS